ncbi:C2orf43 family protein [Megaselia abdita]
MKICEGFLELNSVPVSIKTWGKWIYDPLRDAREIIIFLPGMFAGIPATYNQMLTTLYENLDRQIPIWTIGHSGHDEDQVVKIPPLQGNEDLYDLRGQIKSKAEFIKKHVPSHIKVHLVGHSLGTYIITQLLKDNDIKTKIQKCYLIFPILKGCEDGKITYCARAEFCVRAYQYFGFLLRFMCKTPDIMKTIFFNMFCWMNSTATDLLEGFLRISKPDILDKIVHLTKITVPFLRYSQPEVELLKQNKNILKMYFAVNDGWVPLEFYRELKILIPDIDAEIDTYGIEHGIVWRSSSIMAKIISEMVKSNRVR